MCTRAMRGTYLYVCDKKLREYLSKYIDKYSHDENGIVYTVNEEHERYDYSVAEDNEEYKYE